MAAGKVLFSKACVIDSIEFCYLIPEMFENAADDAIPAGVKFDLHFTFGEPFYKMQAVRLDLPVFQSNSGPDLFKIFEGKILIQGDMVHLGNFMTGMGKFLCQFAIIGQEDQAGGIPVEPAYRIYALRDFLGHDIDHRFPSTFVR